MDNILSFIGLMRRSNHLRLGMDASLELLLNKKARLVALANDAGGDVKKKVGRFEDEGLFVITLPYGKAELGPALGAVQCAVFTVDNYGLAHALAGKLGMAGLEQALAPLAERERRRKRKKLRGKQDRKREG